jgi:ADP-heptose:LPS heptosyltransferase
MHIAAAAGIPVVAVFGSSNSSVWHPWTEAPYRVVEASGTIDQVSVADCIRGIDAVVESALGAVRRTS